MVDIIQKTREDYNKIARHFSGTRYDIWPELVQFKAFIKKGQNILDWGCGNGRLIFLLRGGSQVKYFGIDQSEELIKIAKKKFGDEIKEGWAKFFCTAKKNKRSPVPNERKRDLVLGKFPTGFFDLVFMIASFHHLPTRASRLGLLKKTRKEMKRGARLIITVWNLESDWARKKSAKGWKKIGTNDYLIPWKNPEGKVEAERYYHHFGKDELRGLLEEAGFKIERLDYSDNKNWTDEKAGRNLVAVAVPIL